MADDPLVLVELAAHHRGAGRLRDAILACDAAIRAAPSCVDAWLERGFAFHAGGSMARARECYDRVLALDPGDPAAHAGLAGIAARDGDAMAARAHATAALARDPGNATATLALATVEAEHGDVARAVTLLEALVPRLPQAEPDRSLAHTLLGDAFTRLGRPADAYDNYLQANADFAAVHAARFAERDPHAALVRRIADAVGELAFARPATHQAPHGAAGHLFLLGYPRSGSTLVENVLASLPGVVALEERPTLRTADRAYLADPAGISRLAAEPEAALADMRAAYWQAVAQSGADVRDRTFVDMDPLKGTRLPIIARLFPEAKILVMRRDPRDVVWSCFRTNFALTNAAMDFTTIDGVAQHYDAMMRLIELARERLPLSFHEVRYEALVADFDATTRALCEFAGIEWSEAVRRFDRTAKMRGVGTASAAQVRKGLYDGSGQWRPFDKYLSSVMPLLEPWIERFGYD